MQTNNMHFIFKYLLLLIFVLINVGIILSDFTWSPKYADRDDMICPSFECNEETTLDGSGWELEDCCVCHAKPSWETPTDKTLPLAIEYYRRNGRAFLFNLNSGDNLYFKVYHSHGILREIPINICEFKQQIVKIELMNNWIFEIGNISCLLMLDTLDLSYNKITSINDKTFEGLKHLRVLKLSSNNLQILEPSSITRLSLQIFHADFSNNAMRVVEFSNMISDHDFCHFDFSSNNIKEIINTNHFRIDPKKTYNGGVVKLTGNNFTKFIDYAKLGISDIAILGKVMEYSFVMPDVKWDCDCQMEPYLELAELTLDKIWRDYFDIKCWNPPEHRGKSIPDMVKEGHLDLFICNLTTKQKCPQNCYCFYQPKERRTVVNCTGIGLTKLPQHIPDMDNITLILRNNSIRRLENRHYFKNVSVLDISENILENISSEAIDRLPTDVAVSFANNNLKTFPRVLQTLHPCSAEFGTIRVKCECDYVWVKDWMKNRRTETCTNSTLFMCETDHGYIPINKVSRDDLCPVERSYVLAIVFSVLCVLLVSVSIFVYFWRYEIYLLGRKISPRKPLNKVANMHKYDAFLSFDEENLPIRTWVLNNLSIHLAASGYRIFVPCRDLDFATIREEDVLEKIGGSRNYIMILSDNYNMGNTIWTDIEWKYIWHTFKANLERNVIIINFDQFNSSDIMDPRLRAFIRLGYDIDFSDRDHGLLQKNKR